tara:strand:+ start:2806 stop:6009 length:3204 start_codon:yes stop_codon:yes gene_type:complete
MVQSHGISMQSKNQVEIDDSVFQYHSSKSISTGALAWEWAQKVGGSSADDHSNAIAIDANGDVYVTGSFEQTATFGSTTLSSAGDFDIFVAKMNSTGHWLWAIQAGGNHDDRGLDLAIDTSGNVFVTGKFQSTVQFGSDSLTAGPTANDDFFIAKADTWGNWLWVEGADCHNNGRCYGTSVAVDSAGYAYVTGSFTRDIDFGSTTLTWAGVEDIFVAKIDTWGSWQWATMAGGAQGSDVPHSIDIGPQGNAFIAGSFRFTSTFGTQSMTASGSSDVFIAKISQQGDWLWAHDAGGTSSSGANSIRVDSQGNVFAAGSFYVGISFGNLTYSAGSTENSFIAKANDQGNSATWEWVLQLSSSSSNSAQDLSFDTNEDLLVTGEFRGTASFGNSVLTSSGNQDVYVASILANGNWNWGRIAGSGGDDVGLGIEMDSLGGLYVTGSFLQNTITFGTVDIATSGGFDSFIAKMSSDFDQDSLPDSLDDDDDGDYVLDAVDRCNPSPFGFQSLTSTDHDGDGCRDSDEDLDDDDDGMLDENDECPRGMTGWTPTPATDIDSDGCLDSIEDYDDDNDGYEDYMDLCPRLSGNSTYEFEEGCPDTDGDGRADVKDPFPNNAAEWEDTDRDGVGNNSDAFPDDPTQILDTDGDDFGDHPFGNFPDECPDDYGTSYLDVYGCVDSDGDGVSDLNDQFPYNPDLWQDSDRDGIEDDIDAFPYNPGQWLDSDGDGFGDNPMDANADKFPNDETQWSDVDGDGYGDNPTGNMSDAFPLDPTQWLDTDGDGYGDNPSGNMPDAFPSDTTQWIDQDGDGLGDNQSGLNPDPFLFDSDNDGYNNTEDPLPMYPTPGDRDNDGIPDVEDWDPFDINEWKDTDGDGTGDNADVDDDGDGWDDWDEMRANTDPYDPYDKPVEGWELAITDNIALSAWDLLALASGFPLAVWIIFGLVTRNARTEAYEERMRNATSREELEEVATEYERALMIRLIGPHQGIRLERVRAELDDEIELGEVALTGEEDDLGPVVTTPDQTDYTEEELGLQPPEDAEVIVDEKGYEWVDQGDDKWYRHQGEKAWIKWET